MSEKVFQLRGLNVLAHRPLERRAVGSVDEAKRTVPIKVFTEKGVRRGYRDYGLIEILLCRAENCDLSFLASGRAPLLVNHRGDQQVGVLDGAAFVDDGGEKSVDAVARFSRNPEGEKEFVDVKDEIRTCISGGYYIIDGEFRYAQTEGAPDQFIVTRWRPVEASLCAVPLDEAAGVGRSATGGDFPVEFVQMLQARSLEFRKSSDGPSQDPVAGGPPTEERAVESEQVGEPPAVPSASTEEVALQIRAAKEAEAARQGESATPAGPVLAQRSIMDPKDNTPSAEDIKVQVNEAANKERQRINAIMACARAHKLEDIAAKAIDDGTSAETFNARALDAIVARQSSLVVTPAVDLSPSDKRKFSIGRIGRALLTGDLRLAPHELEVTRAYEKKGVSLRNANSFFIPWEFLGRAVAKGGSGGNLVGTVHMDSEYVPHLLSDLVVRKAGARLLPGLVGDVDIPAGSSGFGTAVHTSAETSDSTEITPAFRSIALSPKTATGYVDFSRKMRLQSEPAVETLIREGLQNSILELVERTSLNGSGATGVPRGILNTTGVVGSPFGDDFTYRDFIDMWSAIKAAKAPGLGLGSFVSTFGVAAKAMTTTRGGSGSDIMIAAMMANGDIRIDGFPVYPTQEMPSDFGSPAELHSVLYGDFARLVIASWGDGIEVTVDPAALAKSGGLRILGFFDYDIAVTLATAFAKAEDVIVAEEE